MADAKGKDIDATTGVPTTGHEWDGIRELNNPLPKWWLWTFYATIVWAVIYWILMPSWPLVTGYTEGLRGHSQRAEVLAAVEAVAVQRAENGAALAAADLETIRTDPAMLEFAMANGRAAFGDNCAPCHGSGAQGFVGYPNLNDDDWLWGGTLDDIYTTLLYGIRSEHDDTRFGDMMAFGDLGVLERGDILNVAGYVRSLSGLEVDAALDLEAGRTVYEDNCAACHGETGEGIAETGAPNLRDAIWLYGSEHDAVVATIAHGRAGVMPAWEARLDPVTIKSLAVYVHSLGGGQPRAD